MVHAVSSRVWVRDPAEGWVKGEVLKLEGPQVVVELEESKEQRRVVAEDALLQNSDARGVEVRKTPPPRRWLCQPLRRFNPFDPSTIPMIRTRLQQLAQSLNCEACVKCSSLRMQHLSTHWPNCL